jgi:hypothetical protein
MPPTTPPAIAPALVEDDPEVVPEFEGEVEMTAAADGVVESICKAVIDGSRTTVSDVSVVQQT